MNPAILPGDDCKIKVPNDTRQDEIYLSISLRRLAELERTGFHG
jgi:hypothetical protein